MRQLQVDVIVEELYRENQPDGLRFTDIDTEEVIVLKPEGVIKLVEFLEHLVK